jgi:hypothetical protein
MLNAADDAADVPVINVAPEAYNAILLGKRVLVVTHGSGKVDFFGRRQCLMTAADEPGPLPPDLTALLRCMVGG